MVDRGPSHWRAARWALAILGVAGIVAVVPLLPLGVPAEGGPDAFSAARAIELIERIAVEPRPIGSAANERARATIVDELERLGLEPELQASEASDWFGLADGSPVPVANVLARIPGTASTGPPPRVKCSICSMRRLRQATSPVSTRRACHGESPGPPPPCCPSWSICLPRP